MAILTDIAGEWNNFRQRWRNDEFFRANIYIHLCILATLGAASLLSQSKLVAVFDKGAICRVAFRISAFAINAVVFFFALRLQAKKEVYHRVKPAVSVHAFDKNLQEIFGLTFSTKATVRDLVFVDTYTVFVVFLFSVGTLCFARISTHPERYYLMHEVFLDLTFHLAAEFIGFKPYIPAIVWTFHLAAEFIGFKPYIPAIVWTLCVLLIILKEITGIVEDQVEGNPQAAPNPDIPTLVLCCLGVA